jgi:glyoxylase-like metal-dependent hydrolase (beta-lactamase superfamily II)
VSESKFPETAVEVAATEPAALKRRIDAGESVTLLDTRAPDEFAAWHIDGPGVEAVNVPHTAFLDGVDEATVAALSRDEEVVVACAVGVSSEFVAERLVEAGYEATHLADGMHGWARLYEHTDVELPTGTLVRQYRRPSSGCLAYMVVADGTAAVVDPLRTFAERYAEDAATLGADLALVLDTHVHADHVSGLRDLAAATGATPAMPAAAADRGVTDAADLRLLADGEAVAVGSATLVARATPGHTTGTATYVVDGTLALAGDTLFVDGVARPDLEAGADGAREAAGLLYDSIHDRLLSLPADALVGAAHHAPGTTPRADGAYLATVADLATLPVLSLDRESFVDRVATDLPPRPPNHEAIVETNLGRRSVGDAEAFEMELGPNNCAAGE